MHKALRNQQPRVISVGHMCIIIQIRSQLVSAEGGDAAPYAVARCYGDAAAQSRAEPRSHGQGVHMARVPAETDLARPWERHGRWGARQAAMTTMHKWCMHRDQRCGSACARYVHRRAKCHMWGGLHSRAQVWNVGRRRWLRAARFRVQALIMC
eukprot:SAG25_NODE_186_length_12406_cov_7.083530_7_plen_154_part_00